MKAWGSKKIIRREELPELELAPWQVDQFSGSSVQRPHIERYAPEPVLPTAEVAELPPEQDIAALLAEVVSGESAVLPEAAVEVPPPSEEETLAALRSAAHQEAYQAGYAEGLEAGRAAGDAAGREAGYAAGLETGQTHGRAAAQLEVEQFQTLLAGLEQARQAYEAEMAQPILEIALAVARQMLRTTLAAEPERILALIRDALNSLPELQGNLRLELHPDDLALVQAMLVNETVSGQWRLEPNADISRGGCKISSANLDLDLTLASRWQRIVEALGRGEISLDGDASVV